MDGISGADSAERPTRRGPGGLWAGTGAEAGGAAWRELGLQALPRCRPGEVHTPLP